MRVLACVHEFPPLTGGGIAAYDLLAGLGRQGAKVTVFCAGWSDRAGQAELTEGREDFVWDGQPMAVRTVGVPFAKEFSGEGRPDLLWFAGMDAVDAAFLRAVDEIFPDIVHYFHFYRQSVRTLSALRHRPLRTVLTLLDYHPFCLWFSPFKVQDLVYCNASDNGRRCRECFTAIYGSFAPHASFGPDKAAAYIDVRRRAMLGVLGGLDALVSPSRFLVARYGAEWPDLARRIRVLHHGLNIAGVARPAPPAGGAVRNLGYFGGNAVSKGVHVVLEAARLLRGQEIAFHLWGPYDSRNVALPEGCRVVPHGIVPRSEVWSRMAEMDAVLQPSYTENYSTVVREAFFCNRPVIAADNTGLPELVEHGVSGLLFRTGDPADLAAKILELAGTPGLHAALVRNLAAREAKPLDAEAAEYSALYRELLAGGKQGKDPGPWPDVSLVQVLAMQKMTGQPAAELLDGLPDDLYRSYCLGRMAYHAEDWERAGCLLESFMAQEGRVPEPVIRMDAAFKLSRVAERRGDLALARRWAGYLNAQGAGGRPGFAQGFNELCGRLGLAGEGAHA